LCGTCAECEKRKQAIVDILKAYYIRKRTEEMPTEAHLK